MLRLESPVKCDFRLALRSTTVGGVDIPAGTPVMLLNGAANRDRRRFECPAEFHGDRENARSHVAFGRGPHTCPGAPLARAEGRISLERILDRTRDIRLDEEHHGPPGAPALPLRADLDPARPHEAVPGVRTGRGRPMSRVAVVTGGASGIGLGAAHQLVADGQRVAILDRNGAAADTAAGELRARGGTALAVEVDVADLASIDAAFARCAPSWVPSRSSSRARASSPSTRCSTSPPRSGNAIIAVNLTGTFASVQAALPDMLAAKWGRIVTIASSSAQSGAPNMAHYAASKGGVISLTKALAVELARRGVTANAITPSLVDTPMSRQAEADGDFPGVDVVAPMVPLGRAGTPADIAAACSFLYSESGSYITGQVIGVNGGMYI